MAKSRQYISPENRVKLTLLLVEHCRLVDGYAAYDEGWSDEKILAAFPEGVSIDHVKITRRFAVGDMKIRGPNMTLRGSQLKELLDTAEKRLAALEAAIISIAGYDRRITRLEERAGVRDNLLGTTSINAPFAKHQ